MEHIYLGKQNDIHKILLCISSKQTLFKDKEQKEVMGDCINSQIFFMTNEQIKYLLENVKSQKAGIDKQIQNSLNSQETLKELPKEFEKFFNEKKDKIKTKKEYQHLNKMCELYFKLSGSKNNLDNLFKLLEIYKSQEEFLEKILNDKLK